MALMTCVEHTHLASCTTRSWPRSLALRRHRSLNSEAIASRCQVLQCSPGQRNSQAVCGKETRRRTQHLQRAGRHHLSGSETSQNLHNDTEADVLSREVNDTLAHRCSNECCLCCQCQIQQHLDEAVRGWPLSLRCHVCSRGYSADLACIQQEWRLTVRRAC